MRRPSISSRRAGSIKRSLLAVHRWLGVTLWIVFCAWFASGIVMMYAGYPELTTARRLALLAPLDLSRCCVPLDRAAQAGGLHSQLRRAAVEMLADRPAYRLEDDSGHRAVVDAEEGGAALAPSLALAARIASRAANISIDSTAAEVLNEPDQWLLEIPRSEFPVARFGVHDSAGTLAYISLRDGEVIQLVNWRERMLAWIGAIPHWIYPASLRRHRDGWRYVVLVLAVCGIIGCLTGLTIGLWRLRRRGVTVRSPFVDGWMRWHHYLGLAFGLFAFTWVFSGFLSLNPFEWSPGNEPSPRETDIMAGGGIDVATPALLPVSAWRFTRDYASVRRLELVRVAGKAYVLAEESGSRRQLFTIDRGRVEPRGHFRRDELVAALRPLTSDGSFRHVSELSTYDDYYYSRDGERPLPVLRVELSDVGGTRYYVDEASGSIVYKSTRRSRLERWLYHGLHSWDFAALLRHPLLWDAVVIALSLGGIALSVTGAVIGVRWLSRGGRRH